jgi:hypothetical protein
VIFSYERTAAANMCSRLKGVKMGKCKCGKSKKDKCDGSCKKDKNKDKKKDKKDKKK